MFPLAIQGMFQMPITQYRYSFNSININTMKLRIQDISSLIVAFKNPVAFLLIS